MTDFLIDQAPDIFCHRLARIDDLGANRRLIFTIPSIDAPGEEHVTVKLIIPADFMVTLAYMVAGADSKLVSRELLALPTVNAN
jgi:hypothetical protein